MLYLVLEFHSFLWLNNISFYLYLYTVVVQLLSCVWLFATPWIAACQVFLSFIISWSLLKLMSIEFCHPTISSSVDLFSSCPQSFPASGSFPMSRLFALGGQSIGASISASVLPVYIQGWFPLAWTGVIPGQGAKIPPALWPKIQNIKQKQYGNRFKKDFKNGPHKKKYL